MYKKLFITAISTFLFLVVGHLLVLIIVDPLSIYKKGFLSKEFYIKEMRFQAAGIINNTAFDSAIVGTSMAENFNATDAGNLMGGHFVNLSLSGSLFKERKIVLDYLLSSRKMKTLIISLDGATELQRNSGIPIETWKYLYNDSVLDDIAVYTNSKYLPYVNCHSLFKNEIIKNVLGKCPEERIRNNINLLTEWHSKPEHNSRFGGISQWNKHRDNPQVKVSVDNIKEANLLLNAKLVNGDVKVNSLYDHKQFNKHILPLAIKYPETKFVLFFPPYSLIKYAIDYQTKRTEFDSYKNMVKQIVLASEEYKNIELYWFNEKSFINEIKNYKDLAHYGAEFNSMFLNDFSVGKSIINRTNYKQNIQSLEKRAEEVDLRKVARSVGG